jgi:hypothetical protein
MTEPIAAADGRTVTVRISISIRKRGGRKLVIAPDGTISGLFVTKNPAASLF